MNRVNECEYDLTDPAMIQEVESLWACLQLLFEAVADPSATLGKDSTTYSTYFEDVLSMGTEVLQFFLSGTFG